MPGRGRIKDPYKGGPPPHPGEQVMGAGIAGIPGLGRGSEATSPSSQGLVGNRSRPPHRRKELWVRVQAAEEEREKKATRRKGLWVRDRGRAAGRGPRCPEDSG